MFILPLSQSLPLPPVPQIAVTRNATVLKARGYAFNLLTGHDLPVPTRHETVRVGVLSGDNDPILA